jgi:hypothetical protein
MPSNAAALADRPEFGLQARMGNIHGRRPWVSSVYVVTKSRGKTVLARIGPSLRDFFSLHVHTHSPRLSGKK